MEPSIEKKLEYTKKYVEFCLKLGQHLSLVGMAIEITKNEAESQGLLEDITSNLNDIIEDLSSLLEDFGEGTMAMAQLLEVKPPNILKDVVESTTMDEEIKKAIVRDLIPTLIEVVKSGQLEKDTGHSLDDESKSEIIEDLQNIIATYTKMDFESVLGRIEDGDSSVFDELLQEINKQGEVE